MPNFVIKIIVIVTDQYVFSQQETAIMGTPSTINATQLFAMSQGAQCKGDRQCYKCSSPCTHQFLKPYEPAPQIGSKAKSHNKIPSSPYQCIGCWLYGKTSVTATYMCEKEFKDRQALKNHSLWITPTKVRAVNPLTDKEALYEVLTSPPSTFCLSLLEGEKPDENMLQYAYVNQNDEVKNDTELKFTVNNVALSYTVYELMEALMNDEASKSPGVSTLLRIFGTYDIGEKKKNGVGRPITKHNPTQQPVITGKRPKAG